MILAPIVQLRFTLTDMFLKSCYITFTYIHCSTATPELFDDATKRLSSEFVQQLEVLVTDPVSSFTLVPGGNAFSFLDSNFELTKFKLPSSPDQVYII